MDRVRAAHASDLEQPALHDNVRPWPARGGTKIVSSHRQSAIYRNQMLFRVTGTEPRRLVCFLVATAWVLFLGTVPTAAATGGTPATGSCEGRDGKIAIIRTEPRGDELGLLSGGRFRRLYEV